MYVNVEKSKSDHEHTVSYTNTACSNTSQSNEDEGYTTAIHMKDPDIDIYTRLMAPINVVYLTNFYNLMLFDLLQKIHDLILPFA